MSSCIGREASVTIAGSRKRRRGYVAEADKNGDLIVAFYPKEGDTITHVEERYTPEQVRLLKSEVLAGWRALDILDQDGSPYISLRFRPDVIERIKHYGVQRDLDFEGAFNQLMKEALERLDPTP